MKFSLSYIFDNSPLIACAIADSEIDSLGDDFIKNADIVELRVDMCDDTSTPHIVEVIKIFKERFLKPILITVRDTKEGGQKEVADKVDIYRAAAPLADMMDIEINSPVFSQIKDICISNNAIFIGSHHNFETTPNNDFLEEIFLKGKNGGADIVKIAAFANSREDFFHLSMFTLKHKEEGIITMSMGDAGLPSRVFNPLFGSLITYGYINRPSAPGQLSIVELADIFRKLKIR